jgi:hypothetical protein
MTKFKFTIVLAKKECSHCGGPVDSDGHCLNENCYRRG